MTTAGAGPQRQLRLHPEPASRNHDRNREIARAGEQIRKKLLPDLPIAPPPFGSEMDGAAGCKGS